MTIEDLENKIIFKTVWGVFGGNPQIREFWDDETEKRVDVVVSADRPHQYVSSYSTVALSDKAMNLDGSADSIGIELVAICESSATSFPNALAAAGFKLLTSSQPCQKGSVFLDVLSEYECSKTMQHLILVAPFLWEGSLIPLELETKKVEWLMAIPISQKEYLYSEEYGSRALEKQFGEAEIDISDIQRSSVF